MRLFTAIELGEKTAADAAALVTALRRRTETTAPRAKVTWVTPDRMHLTLRFIGEADAGQGGRIIDALRESIALPPFDLEWGEPGAFPGKGTPRVLWLAAARGADALAAVEAAITDRLSSLGLTREARPYRPHLTLGRVREAVGLAVPALFEGLHPRVRGTHVDAITLFQSRLSPKGPSYTVLQKTPLKAA